LPLFCFDSGECGAAKICALGPESASCMAKDEADNLGGLTELCGKGTCRLGKATCQTEARGLRVCRSPGTR
jgi:hypothetical protein